MEWPSVPRLIVESPGRPLRTRGGLKFFRPVTAGSPPAQQRPRLRTLLLPLPLASGLPRILGQVWMVVDNVCELTPPPPTCLLSALKVRQLQNREGGREDRRVLPSSPASFS